MASFSAKSRANFTQYHQNSASINARLAKQIEAEHDKHNVQDEIVRIKYISHISSSIISSVASLESKINEFIVDHENQINENIDNVDLKKLQKFKKIETKKDVIEQLNNATSAVLKYKLLFNINIVEVDIDNKTEECLNLLISIRNSIVHFTPEWDNDLAKHKKIEKSVKNHFFLSPFYSGDTLFFPYRCLSANCAEWGIGTTKEFIENHFK